APPPRVRLRVFLRFGGRCAKCRRPIGPGEPWALDHAIALINGGENRERNLQPLCRGVCEPEKTAADVAEKSANYRKAAAHAGIKVRRRWPRRPLPGGKGDTRKRTMSGAVVDRTRQD